MGIRVSILSSSVDILTHLSILPSSKSKKKYIFARPGNSGAKVQRGAPYQETSRDLRHLRETLGKSLGVLS